jgi:uncharacterized membrane protein
MLAGLLPMALYEYASASPDALTIGTSFLFTAVALRARRRGVWRARDIALAMACGLTFCTLKPVYAPLLLIAAPAAWRRGQAAHTVAVHAAIVAVVLGATAAWLVLVPAGVHPPRPEVNAARQVARLRADLWAALAMVGETLWSHKGIYSRQMIGAFGWLTVYMPTFAYVLSGVGLALGTLAGHGTGVRQPKWYVIWDVGLMAGACVLVMLALYVTWTPVGGAAVTGVQGRYFLPCLGLLMSTVACLATRVVNQRVARVLVGVVVGSVLLQSFSMYATIVVAYWRL